MSASVIRAAASTRRLAAIGPSRWKYGSAPIRHCATIRARGRSCSDLARTASTSSTAAAPSEICEDVPAVCRPSSSTGVSRASASRLVSRRPPSRSTDPSAVFTATTSREKRPCAQAVAARSCERRPNASIWSRDSPRRLAIRSAATNWFGRSISQLSGRGEPTSVPTFARSGTRDMASTPQPTPTLIASAAMRPAIRWTA